MQKNRSSDCVNQCVEYFGFFNKVLKMKVQEIPEFVPSKIILPRLLLLDRDGTQKCYLDWRQLCMSDRR